jgi:SAM-dependent methyltransferase
MPERDPAGIAQPLDWPPVASHSVNQSAAYLGEFISAWPLALGKALLRYLEVKAFRRVPALKGTVLDIGCGDGIFTRAVAESCTTIIGIDQDVERLRRASFHGIRGTLADAHQLPFHDSSFDVVISNSTFEHLTHPESALQEASRVLRTRGRLIFTVPTVAKLDNLLFSSVESARYKEHFNQYWRHVTMVSPASWQEMVRRHVPSLALLTGIGFETPGESQLVDLLNSIRATPDTFIGANPELMKLQSKAFGKLLSDLVVDRSLHAGEEYSEYLFEYVKIRQYVR